MPEVLKYLDPIWYFNLNPDKPHPVYFPSFEDLTEEEQKIIEAFGNKSNLSDAEIAFLALKNGIIQQGPATVHKSLNTGSLPVEEQYRFIKKFFPKHWGIYYLLVRLLQFKNPCKEIHSFLNSLEVKTSPLYKQVSSLQPGDFPLPEKITVSIILPTLDRYEYLKGILDDLSLQSIPASEIIIVDQSQPFQKEFYDSFNHLPLKVLFLETKGQWMARNKALQTSTGDFILFADDDSKVKSDWIEQHLRCLLYFNADVSAGVSVPKGKTAGPDKTFFHWADEFDSGNAMVRRSVFEEIGLFDNVFNRHRMGDTEFGLRAYLSGFKSVSNPLASRIHLEASSGGMRTWGSFHAFKPSSFFGPRPDFGVLYLYRKYFDKKYLISFLLGRIFLSYVPLEKKDSLMGYMIAFASFVAFFPLLIGSLIIKWHKAGKTPSDIPSL